MQPLTLQYSCFRTVGRWEGLAKDKELEASETWHFMEVPGEAIVKAKIGAALEGLSVKAYMIKLDRRGVLHRNKG